MPAVHLSDNKGGFVVTPVLTADEARFLVGGLARSTFNEKAVRGGLPWYGDARNKRFLEAEVLAWWKNGWKHPQTETAQPGRRAAGRPPLRPCPIEEGLMDGKTGRIYCAEGEIGSQ